MSAADRWLSGANTAWSRIAHTLGWRAGVNWSGGGFYGDDAPHTVSTIGDAELITSEARDRPGMHRLAIDIDMPAALVPSSTEGHFHLYIDHLMPWNEYRMLLEAFVQAGIVQPGYLNASQARGYTALRVPWLHKNAKEPGYEQSREHHRMA